MNNQPAFPTGIITDEKGKIIGGSNGMTLRDYFAAKAMQAFMSGWIGRDIYPETDMVIAEHAYSMADAMMKAREA
jgi:hypothetical protein